MISSVAKAGPCKLSLCRRCVLSLLERCRQQQAQQARENDDPLVTMDRTVERSPSSASVARGRSRSSEGGVTVAVSLRMRPEMPHLDGDAHAPRPPEPIELHDNRKAASYRGTSYRFAKTFDTDTPTADIFDTQRDAVVSVLSGFDATLMAYGQTGSGKTYSVIGDPPEEGIVPRAVR